MPKPSETYNLYVLRPDLAKEWHPTRNGGLGPRDVTPGSSRKVWWLCDKGHWWLASVRDRARGMKCTFCREWLSQDEQRMADAKPELLREWHLTRNPNLKAREVSINHPDKLWWICEQGHEWEATVRLRLAGKGCPVCNHLAAPASSPSKPGEALPSRASGSGSSPGAYPRLAAFREAASSPASGKELRRGRRYERPTVVMIEKARAGILGYAELHNFSAGGMMLRSEFSINPGEIVTVKLDRPLHSSTSTTMSGRVIWCRNMEAEDEEASPFGIGLSLIG